LGPSVRRGLDTAAREKVGAWVVPMAFVSEHVETLVELDIEYGELAHTLGVAPYLRVPAVGTSETFIATLAEATLHGLSRTGVAPYGPGCRGNWKACPCQAENRAA